MGIIVLLVILAVIASSSVKTVEQGRVGLVETLGKYSGTRGPGLTFVLPGVQKVRVVDIREQVIDVPEQRIITQDNVSVIVDGVVYVQITDPFQAIYDVNNVFNAVISLAQTNLRSVLGTMSLDQTLSNRENINAQLLESLDKETVKWWVKVLRVEIQKLDPPMDIQDAMSKQMKAEREKRAQILEAEGYKQAQITRSEGDKQSEILKAEAKKQSDILKAEGEAKAEIALAEAKAKALELESIAATQFFNGAAVTKEQLKVIEWALGQNTKYILDSDILAGVSKIFGAK